MPYTEPFVRWAGGKTWLIPHLSSIINNLHIEHYHEPFVGGGAVFFSLEHNKKSYLSDANPQLINTYVQIRDNPQGIIEYFLQYNNTEEEYYRIRDHVIPQNDLEAAARFLYLNQTSYNGLFRVNRQGEYNVPYGFRKKWHYDVNRLFEASDKLKNTRISVGDFEVNKYRIQEHDLVFLDPPYTVSHNNNGFIEYNQNLFSLDDQKRLSKFIDYIKNKNAYYILTNAAHPVIREIFEKPDDRRLELQRHSLIGGKKANRAEISEYIFTNIPEGENHDI
ncbi:MAG: Dam family site-specific DNA-(adenine-N6)-methyltransferase [Ruminococcaceae bacterium]|nr:Dam family site-specific DNA-(adenine-N6)-methyltransferase [Oscillospiraceae bacterium]